MPYYCTVPRCTSMAGKAKNVSFHQFPRDEELARLWNNILKRGKPYTKYSKVCSLHFRPEDYTITSVGKNKGQWRTLRKDAIPSQNLPPESPGPTTIRNTRSWMPPTVMDTTTRAQQQVAQAIYMQTMLAMQAATNNGSSTLPSQVTNPIESMLANTSNSPISEIEQLLQNTSRNGIHSLPTTEEDVHETRSIKQENHTSYKCEECSKCFKDPDVFVLHRRTHKKSEERIPEKLSIVEKENLNINSAARQETLKANPILANLLKATVPSDIQELPSNLNNVFDVNNILSIENQIMAALAANMENYIRNLSSMLAHQPKDTPESSQNDSDDDSNEIPHSNEDDTKNNKEIKTESNDYEAYNNMNDEKSNQGSPIESHCDNEDLNESKDSNNLVIDEVV